MSRTEEIRAELRADAIRALLLVAVLIAAGTVAGAAAAWVAKSLGYAPECRCICDGQP
jgi:hypothetical protein